MAHFRLGLLSAVDQDPDGSCGQQGLQDAGAGTRQQLQVVVNEEGAEQVDADAEAEATAGADQSGS